MDFGSYYKNKRVVDSYDSVRVNGIKAAIIRMLELKMVDLLVEKNDKQKILEIGIGTGFISKLLVTKGKFCGMDSSKEMLKKTKENLGKVKLVEGSILNIKIKEKFDKVVTIRVISHFNKKDTITALKNVNKILEKGGEVIFNLENKSLLRRVLRKLRNWGGTYNYQYAERDIFEIAKESGFDVTEIVYIDHLFILPLHLLNKILVNSLNRFIFNIEIKLRKVRLMSGNSFIKCRK